MTLRVGTAGWSYPDWEGIVYPSPAPKGFDPLLFLARLFDTLELNNTFYRPPSVRMSASWARRVQENQRFRFTAKVWNRLTHEKSGYTRSDVLEFCKGLDPLLEENLLGALLLQFPWSFKNGPEERERLARIARELKMFPLVLEVRHASWNDPQLFEFLRREGIGFCNIDQPVIGQSLRPSAVVTSGIGYFRLHGRNYRDWFREDAGRDQRYDYLYEPRELDSLAELIREVEQASEEAYVVTNNHFRGKAVCNALELQAAVSGRRPEIPRQLLLEYPRLQPP